MRWAFEQDLKLKERAKGGLCASGAWDWGDEITQALWDPWRHSMCEWRVGCLLACAWLFPACPACPPRRLSRRRRREGGRPRSWLTTASPRRHGASVGYSVAGSGPTTQTVYVLPHTWCLGVDGVGVTCYWGLLAFERFMEKAGPIACISPYLAPHVPFASST